jgi:Protein of unknown function (DUF3616)
MRDLRIPVIICALASWPAAAAAEVKSEGKVRLNGALSEPADLSGLALHGRLLVVCPDEGAKLNVLEPASPEAFDALPPIQLLDDETAEIDMEGAASDGRHVFVVGSHSKARKKLDADRTYEKNRRRLTQIDDQVSRYNVFRLAFDEAGKCMSRDNISLAKILRNDEILAPFTKLPGKENGIDIEGIAAADGMLYLGFRGPVLRGNYVPVLALKYDAPHEYQLLFVDLAGRGIRDLAAVAGGLLVLAGPVGDGDGSYELYFWNKRDCVPGQDSPRGKVTHVGTVGSSRDSKPEGIAVLAEANGDVQLLLVCDGSAERSLERIRIAIPR